MTILSLLALPSSLIAKDKTVGLLEVISSIRSNQPLDTSDTQRLTAAEIRIARNAVFARHGRIFKSPELNCFFHGRDWYSAEKDYSDNQLTDNDRANVQVLLKASKKPYRPDQSSASGAMRLFLDAIMRGEAESFLSLCHPDHPLNMVSFEVGSLKKVNEFKLSRARLKGDFAAKAWQYENLIGPLQQAYHLRITLVSVPFQEWQSDGSGTFHLPRKNTKVYVKWKKIDGRWFLAELGDIVV